MGIKDCPARHPSSCNENAQSPSFFQRLYRRNRRRAIRLILQEDFTSCSIAPDVLAEHFFKVSSAFPCLKIFNHPLPATDSVDIHPFSPEEVWAKLKSAENSAPGLDRITYHHWKKVYPDGKCLVSIFHFCLKAFFIPDERKLWKIVFILKKGGGDSPSD